MSTASTTPAPTPGSEWAGPQRFAVIAAVAGLATYAVVGFIGLGSASHADAGKAQFFRAWSVGFVYWLSLPIGGLALLCIHYLAKTSWGILLKKTLEAATRTLPLFVVLFIPIAVGASMHGASPFWWTAPDETMITPEMEQAQQRYDDVLASQARGEQAKLKPEDGSLVMQRRAIKHELEERHEGTFGFLTVPGFVVLGLVYFAIWGVLIYFFNKWGRAADLSPANVPDTLERGKNLAGPGLIIYAIVGTAAASHWVMSFEPSWASTMFPVIYSVNQMLTALAFGIAVFLSLGLNEKPQFKEFVTRTKFKLDMGTFMLALTLFWSYTSFSQLMLVWIGNLPEEIPYYLKRSAGGWWWVSAFLIVFHFAVPFVVMLFRDIKNYPRRLRFMAVYAMVMCAVDVAWWIEPTSKHDGMPLFWLMDVGAIVGIGGLFGLFFIYQLRKAGTLLPQNELYTLPESHEHHDDHGHNGGHAHGH